MDEGVAVLLANIIASAPSRFVPRAAIQLLVNVLKRSQAVPPPQSKARPPPAQAPPAASPGTLTTVKSSGRLHLAQSAQLASSGHTPSAAATVPGVAAGVAESSAGLAPMRAEAAVSPYCLGGDASP